MTAPKRKLAAIVFTDIVGFTKLTSEDQTSAAALLVQQRELFKPMVESRNGKWVKEIGDGLLLTFDTVTDAVECCVELQEKIKHIEQTAGYNIVQWNTTNTFGEAVSAGLYLYTIHADNFTQTKKMVLLK